MKKRKQLHPRVLVSAVILLVLAVLALWKAGGMLSSGETGAAAAQEEGVALAEVPDETE